MIRSPYTQRLLIVAASLFIGMSGGPCPSHAQSTGTVGTIYSIEGSAYIDRAGSKLQLSAGSTVLNGDAIVVSDVGRVAVALNDGSYIRVGAGSTIRFPGDEHLELPTGEMHLLGHAGTHPIITTPHATAAIRGTEISLRVDNSETDISVISGVVEGNSPNGSLEITSLHRASFVVGRTPHVEAIIRAERVVQWGAFVPLFESEQDYGDASRSDPSIHAALQSVAVGDFSGALAALSATPQECSLRAVMKWRLVIEGGNVDLGRSKLESCLTTSGSFEGNALTAATLGLVAFARGDLNAAEKFAYKIPEANQEIPSARFLLSLIRQSRGDLDGALSAVTRGADSLDQPQNITVRRAELLFALGHIPEARSLLEGIQQRSWYGEAIFGFVLLSDREVDPAAAAFERARAATSASGLPYLGLGLVAMSRGARPKAISMFERAVFLEPTRSTFRSYLAKAYFESNTYSPASAEFNSAIAMDSNDPTPYLYRSFMRVAQNDPVGALSDLERSTELSSNRSVYRSSLLLDDDSAVQSASIARVYRDLGFNERGRLDAIRSISSDYTNPAAHRLLAESSGRLFTDEATLSERRIASLFAPLSINVVDAIAPGVSLNEYSALFEQDGWRTGVGTTFDSVDDVYTQSVMTATKAGNVAAGIGVAGSIRDGGDPDPGSTQGEVGATVQIQPSWADKFVFEGRGRSDSSNEREEDFSFREGSANAAYIHRFSPETTAIVQSSFNRNREHHDIPRDPIALVSGQIIDGELDQQLIGATVDRTYTTYDSTTLNEAQVIDRREILTSIFTSRSFTSRPNSSDTATILEDDLGELTGQNVQVASSAPTNLNSFSSSYLGDLKLLPGLHLNFGGAFESVEWASRTIPPFVSNKESDTMWSPRGGIMYSPSDATTLRLGYSEHLGVSTQGDRVSIEPTLVGGINQRFADLPGTRAQVLGTGGDFKFLGRSYVGAEWSRRWLDESRTNGAYSLTVDGADGSASDGVVLNERTDVAVNQNFAHAYFYRVISAQAVTGIDYQFAREARSAPDDSTLNDHTAVLFSRYFFTTGLFLQGSGTYQYQSRGNVTTVTDGSDGGWRLGAGLGYRLPERRGLLLAEIRNIFGEDIALEQLGGFSAPTSNDPSVLLSARVNF